MADATVNIIIKATDKASGALKGFKASIAELGKSVPGLGKAMSLLGNPMTLMAGGITAIGLEMGRSMQKAQEYALSMGDLAKVWNTSTEEASKLVQVADDVRVSQDQLANAMKIAMRQGVEPTIAGLQDAAKTYQSFTNTQERATWAAKTFGRQWTEVSRLLELTPEQIDASVASAEKFGLVVGDDAVAAAKKYYDALDTMRDRQEGLEVQLGNKLIPKYTDFLMLLTDLTSLDTASWFDDGANASANFINSFFGLKDATEQVTSSLSAGMGDLRAYESGLNDLAGAADEAGEANSRVAISITEVSKTSAAKTAIDILTAAYKADAIEADVYAVKMSDIMRNWLDMPMAQVTASIAIQTIQEDLDDGKISALEASAAILGVGAAADAINGKSATVTVHTEYTSSGAPLPTNPKAPTRRRALGGPVSAGQSYLVGERGPEMFVPMQNGRIIPNVTNNYGSNNNAEVIAAIRNNRLDEARLARLMRDQFAKVAG
jgi:hypothetical protein